MATASQLTQRNQMHIARQICHGGVEKVEAQFMWMRNQHRVAILAGDAQSALEFCFDGIAREMMIEEHISLRGRYLPLLGHSISKRVG